MNPEIAAQWTAALRSGKYKQTTERLQRDGEFCCLGVLCELAVEQDVIPAPVPVHIDEERTEFYYGIGNGKHHAMLPHSVKEWAGMKSYLGYVNIEQVGNHDALVEYNDRLGKTFSEIADIIDANKDTL